MILIALRTRVTAADRILHVRRIERRVGNTPRDAPAGIQRVALVVRRRHRCKRTGDVVGIRAALILIAVVKTPNAPECKALLTSGRHWGHRRRRTASQTRGTRVTVGVTIFSHIGTTNRIVASRSAVTAGRAPCRDRRGHNAGQRGRRATANTLLGPWSGESGLTTRSWRGGARACRIQSGNIVNHAIAVVVFPCIRAGLGRGRDRLRTIGNAISRTHAYANRTCTSRAWHSAGSAARCRGYDAQGQDRRDARLARRERIEVRCTRDDIVEIRSIISTADG